MDAALNNQESIIDSSMHLNSSCKELIERNNQLRELNHWLQSQIQMDGSPQISKVEEHQKENEEGKEQVCEIQQTIRRLNAMSERGDLMNELKQKSDLIEKLTKQVEKLKENEAKIVKRQNVSADTEVIPQMLKFLEGTKRQGASAQRDLDEISISASEAADEKIAQLLQLGVQRLISINKEKYEILRRQRSEIAELKERVKSADINLKKVDELQHQLYSVNAEKCRVSRDLHKIECEMVKMQNDHRRSHRLNCACKRKI